MSPYMEPHTLKIQTSIKHVKDIVITTKLTIITWSNASASLNFSRNVFFFIMKFFAKI